MIPFLSKSQDTLIVKSDILTENMIVYKDSIGITKIGEIEKKYGVFLLAPNQNGYFLVYRNGLTGYASKSFIDVNEYWSKKLTYSNLEWKYAKVRILDSIENIEIIKQLKKELVQEQIKLDKILTIGQKNGISISSFVPNFEDYKVGFSFIITNFKKSKIKYTYITVSGYNDVNDIESTKSFICVGPIEYLKGAKYTFEDGFYSKVISELKIRKVIIEYFDGTKRIYEGSTLKQIQD